MEPLILPIIFIFAITTVITCLYKFYEGIWLIHKRIEMQNEILEEQNEILLKFLEKNKNENSESNS